VQELAGRNGLVIATGGGVVLNPDNVSDFSRTGLVVCLSADPVRILERVGSDTNRPLLAGDNKREKIESLLARRQPLYAALPVQVDTTDLSVEDVADRILALYEEGYATA
jgi:shikimate kinase